MCVEMVASIFVPREFVQPPQSILYGLSFNVEDILGCMPPPLFGIRTNPTLQLLFLLAQTLLVSLRISMTLQIPV